MPITRKTAKNLSDRVSDKEKEGALYSPAVRETERRSALAKGAPQITQQSDDPDRQDNRIKASFAKGKPKARIGK